MNKSKTTIQPLNDRVFIERTPANEKSGDLYIPPQAQEPPQSGIVRFAGPGVMQPNGQRRALEVKVGDRVVFGKHSGSQIEIDGVKLLMIPESAILGIVESA